MRARGRHVAKRKRLIAKAMPLLQQQEPHFAQTLGRWRRLARVGSRADQYELLAEQRDLLKGGFRHRQRDDGCIKPPFRLFAQQL
jgi:hypothetical protein